MPFARLFAVLHGWRQRELDHWRLELPRTPYRIWLERSRISFSCAPKNPDSLIYQTAITMWRAPGKKDWPNVFWGFTLRVSLFWCVVLMWQFHTSMLKKVIQTILRMSCPFFLMAIFLFVDFGILKKTWCFFFLGVRDNRGTSLVGLQRATKRPTRQRPPPLVVLVQVQPSPERWNLRRRRNPGRSRNGTRPGPRVAEEHLQGEVFNPPEFFFLQKRAEIFFLKICVVFFWFEVGLYGPTKRARESLTWFYFVFVKYSDEICIVLRTWHYLSW